MSTSSSPRPNHQPYVQQPRPAEPPHPQQDSIDSNAKSNSNKPSHRSQNSSTSHRSQNSPTHRSQNSPTHRSQNSPTSHRSQNSPTHRSQNSPTSHRSQNSPTSHRSVNSPTSPSSLANDGPKSPDQNRSQSLNDHHDSQHADTNENPSDTNSHSAAAAPKDHTSDGDLNITTQNTSDTDRKESDNTNNNSTKTPNNNTGHNSLPSSNIKDSTELDESTAAKKGHTFPDQTPSYLDASWASNLLLDANSDVLYNMDFSASTGVPHNNSSNSIAHNIQYQNDIHLDLDLHDPSLTYDPADPNNTNIDTNTSPPQHISQNNNKPYPHPQPGSSQPHFLPNQSQNSSQLQFSNSAMPSSHPQAQQHNLPQSVSGLSTAPTSALSTAVPPAPASASAPIPATKTKQRRPCDHCRRKKTKCVIIPGTNNCAQCESKSLTCKYVGEAVKRKPTTDSLEGAPSKRKTKKDKDDADNSNGAAASNVNPNLALFQHGEIIPPNVPIRDVAPIQDYSSMNNSLLRKTLSLQFPRSSFYVGPTSYLYDINLLNLIIASQNASTDSPGLANKRPDSRSPGGTPPNSKIEQINLHPSVSLRKVNEKTQFILKDDQSPQSYQTMSHDVDTIEKFIAPHGQILIDLYFRIIHPSYPILHKKVFLEKYSRTHREFSAPLLAAVYVLAVQWWDYDPQLNRFPRPNVDLILRIGLNNYLLEILKRPKLSAVQAGLLLLQCKHTLRVSHNQNTQNRNNSNDNSNPTNNTSNSNNGGSPPNATANTGFNDSDYSDWVLCSQIVALAEELGLGLDCNNWKLPKWERGLRKRLAWAVYMEDKWLSLKNSRPSHIHEDNWVVVGLLEEDFPEKHGDGDLKEGSSDIDNGKKNFMCSVELSKILADILSQLYSMKAMKSITDINTVLRLAKPLQLRLRNWYHSLPLELQMGSLQPRKLCSNGYLHLAYFATELTLHRKIITIIYQQLQNGESPPNQLITVCRAAAKTRLLASIEFVRDLKPEHIHSFWHSSSSANFTLIGTFAAILFMSSTTKEEADFYKDQIFNYRWILKISSKGFDQVGDALLELDMVLNHVPGLLNDSAELPMVLPQVPTIDYQKLQRQQSQQQPQQQPQQQSQQQRPINTMSPQKRSPYINSSGRPSPVMYSNGPASISSQSFNMPNSASRPASQNARHYRGNSQQSAHSPYNSPHNYTTPPITNSQPAAGNMFVANSPQSSQGFSPKENIKQQRPVVPQGPLSKQESNGRNGEGTTPSEKSGISPNSRVSSPVMERSRQAGSQMSKLSNVNQNDDGQR